MRQFLGFAGYYRRFVKGFSKIAKLLADLMPSPTKGKKKKGKRNTGKGSEPVRWTWGPEQEAAFEKLKGIFGFASGFGLP